MHEGTDFALKFTAKNIDNFVPFAGMQIDVNGKKLDEGIITEVIPMPKGLYKIMVQEKGAELP